MDMKIKMNYRRILLAASTVLCLTTLNAATLSPFYSFMPFHVVDTTIGQSHLFNPVTADLNGDGNQDLLVLGANYPGGSIINTPQTGGLFWGDGNGGFTKASEAVFPSSTLLTVHTRKVLINDFNNDGRLDIFLSNTGWDAPPSPSEQNRLYLSKSDGTWYDATSSLPPLMDFSHTSAAGDINNDGKVDIFVGNGYAGQNRIFSYMLNNLGNATFLLDRSNIPGNHSILDFEGYGAGNSEGPHIFAGATFTDLNNDHFPELIITADASESFNANRQSAILWNAKGKFAQNNLTLLPVPKDTSDQIAEDIEPMDINGDGLKDLIVIGTQGKPFYDGWFVQILLNQGGKNFVDMTSTYLVPADSWGGEHGVATQSPWAMWVNVIDFNHDGFSDFAVEYNGPVADSTPFVYLNDGTGHFTTFKKSDFFDKNQSLAWYYHLYETKNGYSFIDNRPGYGVETSLSLGGLIATTPYTAKIPSDGSALLFGDTGNDTFNGGSGNDVINGGNGIDTSIYAGNISGYRVSKNPNGTVTVNNLTVTNDTDTLTSIERLQFNDVIVNLTIQDKASTLSASDLKNLEELYVAFFRRIPDANGLEYWMDQIKNGQSLTQVADSFYAAGVQFSSVTGYTSTMSNADFIKVIYANVLGRTGSNAPDDNEIGYWNDRLITGADTRGAMVNTMLNIVHTQYANDPVWGWVGKALDNKASVANQFAVIWGLNYLTPEDSIAKGMAIATAVTPDSTSEAMKLIGVSLVFL